MRIKRKPLSVLFPPLLPIILGIRRSGSAILTSGNNYSLQHARLSDNYHRVFHHKSVLRRKLGTTDPHLQEQKIINLKIAAPHFNTISLAAGKTFSFWKVLGEPSLSRGFVPGMLLSNGKVLTGTGGGLCQLANLLYWMFLHSPLTISEHHHHQFDVFPDSGRVLPFGSGASVFYNFIDLKVTNTTQYTFVLTVSVSEHYLHGELYADQPIVERYSVVDEDHYFYKNGAQVFRHNRLFRKTIDSRTGKLIHRVLITENNSRVLYPVDDSCIERVS